MHEFKDGLEFCVSLELLFDEIFHGFDIMIGGFFNLPDPEGRMPR